jgi:hypothetical protein
MSYWVSEAETYGRTAIFVDKILKGTKPADLPVEQPSKFELVINAMMVMMMAMTLSLNAAMRSVPKLPVPASLRCCGSISLSSTIRTISAVGCATRTFLSPRLTAFCFDAPALLQGASSRFGGILIQPMRVRLKPVASASRRVGFPV